MNYRYERIKRFLKQDNFQGFSRKDLFIKNFISKAWGQDIAALSNVAEALRNTKNDNNFRSHSRALRSEKIFLIDESFSLRFTPR